MTYEQFSFRPPLAAHLKPADFKRCIDAAEPIPGIPFDDDLAIIGMASEIVNLFIYFPIYWMAMERASPPTASVSSRQWPGMTVWPLSRARCAGPLDVPATSRCGPRDDYSAINIA